MMVVAVGAAAFALGIAAGFVVLFYLAVRHR